MKRKKACQNYWSRRTDKKLYIQTTRWILGKGVKFWWWKHLNTTPRRSETNGIAERAVRRVKEGTSAVLLQSGLDERWLSDSTECFCCLRNIQVLLGDGKTLYESSFVKFFQLNIIRFLEKKTIQEFIIFAKKYHQESFSALRWSREAFWKGDIPLADMAGLEKFDASGIYFRRVNAIEI